VLAQVVSLDSVKRKQAALDLIKRKGSLGALRNKNGKQIEKYNSRMPNNRDRRQFSILPINPNKYKVKTLSDTANRIIILQDNLPIFCSTLAQIDILEQWREGTYADLANNPITMTEAWAVVKLVYTSTNYTSDQQTAIYDDQNTKTPGLMAELA